MGCRVICVVCIPNVCSLIEQPQKLLYEISCDFCTPIAKHSPSQHVIWTYIHIYIESSNMCINTLERLDPQTQNNQFKLYDKQQVCEK